MKYIAVISDGLNSFNKYVKKHGKKNYYYFHVNNNSIYVNGDLINQLKGIELESIVICGRTEDIYLLNYKLSVCLDRTKKNVITITFDEQNNLSKKDNKKLLQKSPSKFKLKHTFKPKIKVNKRNFYAVVSSID